MKAAFILIVALLGSVAHAALPEGVSQGIHLYGVNVLEALGLVIVAGMFIKILRGMLRDMTNGHG